MYFTIQKKRSVATLLYHDFKVQKGIGSKNNLMDDCLFLNVPIVFISFMVKTLTEGIFSVFGHQHDSSK